MLRPGNSRQMGPWFWEADESWDSVTRTSWAECSIRKAAHPGGALCAVRMDAARMLPVPGSAVLGSTGPAPRGVKVLALAPAANRFENATRPAPLPEFDGNRTGRAYGGTSRFSPIFLD